MRRNLMYCFNFLQLSRTTGGSLRQKLINYFKTSWNSLKVTSNIIFMFATIARWVAFLLKIQVLLDWMRSILSVDMVLFFVQLLHNLSAHKLLGPKIVMIQRMVSVKYFSQVTNISGSFQSSH